MAYIIKKTGENKEKCEKVIYLEIAAQAISKHRGNALKKMASSADIPGFRKGHTPESVIAERLGEAALLEESINSWLKEIVPEIIEKEAKDAIALPRVSITKAVPGNPVELTLNIPLRPKLELPDYKVIAAQKNKKKEEVSPTTEKQVDDAILRLREYAARAVNPKLSTHPKEEELPPLNDQFAEAVGAGKTVAELRERIKKDLENENKMRAKEKQRLSIIEEILKKTKGVIPDILVDHEVDKMRSEFEEDVKRMGLKLEDYLKQSNKKEEDIIKEWRPTADKRARVNLILAEIKKNEKIEAPKEEIEKEVKHLLEHYKDANPEDIKSYVERMLSNQKVFEWLEGQA